MGRTLAFSHPFDTILWFPRGNIRSSLIVHKIYAFFLHWVPAYFIDFLLFLFRQKRLYVKDHLDYCFIKVGKKSIGSDNQIFCFSMIRVQNRIALGLEYLQYFTTRQWCFMNKNFLDLRDEMHPEDKKLFPIDFKAIETLPYLADCLTGARVFCLKEPLKNLPRARRMIKM